MTVKAAELKIQGVAPIFEKFYTFAKNNTAQLKIIRFYSSKKNNERIIEKIFYSIKLPSASTTASIRDRKHLQAFAAVSLLRLPITSFIFCTRESEVLWGVLLTCNSATPHTK